jgi:hypothetical protein
VCALTRVKLDADIDDDDNDIDDDDNDVDDDNNNVDDGVDDVVGSKKQKNSIEIIASLAPAGAELGLRLMLTNRRDKITLMAVTS